MVSREKLRFAAFFPFTDTARQILIQEKIELKDFTDSEKNASLIRFQFALEKKPLDIEGLDDSLDVMKYFLFSYPVARLMVSSTNSREYCSAFAFSTARTARIALEKKEDGFDLAIKLLKDLQIAFKPDPLIDKAVKIKAIDYLKHFSIISPKLLTLNMKKGKVLLSLPKLIDFLEGIAFNKAITNLPLDTSSCPKWIFNLSKDSIKSHRKVEEKKFAKIKGFTGTANPTAFPPCMKSMYQSILAGENLPHMARFYLASFLLSVNMPLDGVVKVFSYTANFDEKITKYHIQNIKNKGYKPPSCMKVREQGYCPEKDCQRKHPVTEYANSLKTSKPIQK